MNRTALVALLALFLVGVTVNAFILLKITGGKLPFKVPPLRSQRQATPISESGQVGGQYRVIKQIDAFSSIYDANPSGYIVVGKLFRLIEERDQWWRIKMIMPDGGDYGWEGWIRKENYKYQISNDK